MVCSILGIEIFDAGHIKCSRGPHLARRPQVIQTCAVTVQSQLCRTLIAALSYSNFEIIQLQRIKSATKSNI